MRQKIGAAVITVAATLGAAAVATPAVAVTTTYVVRTTNDNGPESLRDAIESANSNAGSDTITFDIPAGVGSPPVITPVADLPPITDPVAILGYSQRGARAATSATPAAVGIVINAVNASYGLFLDTDDSVITGLAVHSAQGPADDDAICRSEGICVNGHRNLILGNHVGLFQRFNGAIPVGNHGSGVQIIGDGNVVGGTYPGARNVIADNRHAGVKIDGSYNVVQGNLIGTNATGSVALGNDGDGVFISGGANNWVGGNAGARNVISGNGEHGVALGSSKNIVENNLIGTDVTGTALLGNQHGVSIFAGANNRVGGAATGNVISGNGTGVDIGADATGSRVEANLIGTDITGLAGFAAGGGNDGIVNLGTSGTFTANVIAMMSGDGLLLDGTDNTVVGNKIGTTADGRQALGNATGVAIEGDNNTVGGVTDDLANVISGNAGEGVELDPFATGNVVMGNLIGTDAGGQTALGNGGNGVHVEGDGNQLGGPLAGNVISANGGHGVFIDGGDDNLVIANFIGTDGIGAGKNIGNTGSGVFMDSATNTIGSTATTVEPNVIAFNGADGVTVDNVGGSDDTIVRNLIFGNADLGIDLDDDGPTANDPPAAMDADAGSNNLQNFPVLRSASNVNGVTTVRWRIGSLADTEFRLEFFLASGCGAMRGEAKTFLGDTLTPRTSLGGVGQGDTTTVVSVSAGQSIIATATVSTAGVLGATSEFSACITVA